MVAEKSHTVAQMVQKPIDLRSDTVTRPTDSMRAAMAEAEVDDDVLGHDPTAVHLEAEVARMMGKEAGLFVPSGTMGNLISILVHCDVRGSEVILGDNCHIHVYENGGISTLGGVHPKTVPNNEDGTMDLDAIEASIRGLDGDLHYPTTKLICLENSHANSGGRCLSVEYTDKVGQLAKKYGLMLHIDGARIFNAAMALKVPVQRLVEAGDSVSIGVICSAALVALKENVDKLEDDHRKAKMLADGLNQIKGLEVNVNSVQTNIVYVDLIETNSGAPELCKNMKEHGILALPENQSRIRFVIHHQISESDVHYTLSCIQQAISGATSDAC
ncbi:hypothetical protein V2J09_022898 [Rumex salicifolius]